ncbi:hypothetical protein HID58_093531, partial [Brassica napus]
AESEPNHLSSWFNLLLNALATQSPLVFAPPNESSDALTDPSGQTVSISISLCREGENRFFFFFTYLKQDMFLLLNPRGEDDFTKTHLQVTGTLFLPYDSDTEPRSSTLVHLIEVSRSALTVGRDTIMQLHKEKAPYVAKANESQG